MENLIKERRCVYNKIRRCRSDGKKVLLQQDVESLSDEIKDLRKEVMLYEGIKVRSESIRQKLKQIQEEEKQKTRKTKYKNKEVK